VRLWLDKDVLIERSPNGLRSVVQLTLQHKDDRGVTEGSSWSSEHEQVGQTGKHGALVVRFDATVYLTRCCGVSSAHAFRYGVTGDVKAGRGD
jgi:hypothetical protein